MNGIIAFDLLSDALQYYAAQRQVGSASPQVIYILETRISRLFLQANVVATPNPVAVTAANSARAHATIDVSLPAVAVLHNPVNP